MKIMRHGRKQNPQWSIFKEHQKLSRERDGNTGYTVNELNEIKKEVDRYLNGGETKDINIAPTRGMKYNNNSCWFDALAFVILADPTEQIVRCLEKHENDFAPYLLGLRSYMYRETDDPDYEYTRETLNNWGYDTERQEIVLLPNLMNDVIGCEIFMLEHAVDEDADFVYNADATILIIRRPDITIEQDGNVTSPKHLAEIYNAKLYGHVFYNEERVRGKTIRHFTSGIYVNDGKFLYYDDNDIIENRLRFLEDVPNKSPKSGNRFTATWNVYYRIVDQTSHTQQAETKSHRHTDAIAETKAHRVAKRLMQCTESKDHSAYVNVFENHTNIEDTMKKIRKIAINAVNRFFQENIRDKITKDTLFGLFLNSYDHIHRALQDGENAQTLVFHCENNLSKFLWDVQTTIKNIEKRRNGRQPGIYLDTYDKGEFASTQIYVLDGNGNILTRGENTQLNVNACIFYDMEGHVVERDKLRKDQVYQVFRIPEVRFDRVRFIYQDEFEKTREMIRSRILDVGEKTGEGRLMLADKIIFIENDNLTDFDDLISKYSEDEMVLIRESYQELSSHMSKFDATLVIKSIFKERAKRSENLLDAISDEENNKDEE